MAPTPLSQAQGHTEALSIKQKVVDRLATSDTGTLCVDFLYVVVWPSAEAPSSSPRPLTPLAAEGPSSFGLTSYRTLPYAPPRLPPLWMAVESPSFGPTSYQTPYDSPSLYRTSASSTPHFQPQVQSVDITNSVEKLRKWSRGPQSILKPAPEGKISCMARIDLTHTNFKSLYTCLYDIATESFSDFLFHDGTWGQQIVSRHYPYVQLSMQKLTRGDWVSVKDDDGNDFLFLIIQKDHGDVMQWRPDMVAKRVGFGEEEVELTAEEAMRLGTITMTQSNG